MIKSHEQAMELRLPRIGVIRKGAPKPERGPGKDLDYFRLDRAEQSVITAWNETLGKEPKAISGILPYTDPAECLSVWDELWQGKRLLWRGDGERLHVKLEGNAYVRYAPGSGPAQPAAAGEMVNKLKVARISHLRILLPQLRIAGIFEIMSSSAIDADELWSNLMWIKSTVATLQGAPVTVFRAARQFNVAQDDGKIMVVTKHMLHLMLDGRYLDALLPSPVSGLLAPVQPAPALSAGQAIEDDAPEDADYEDDPPAPQPALAPAKPQAAPPSTNGNKLYNNGVVVRPEKLEAYNAYREAHGGNVPENPKHLDNWIAQRNAQPAPVIPTLESIMSEPAEQTALAIDDPDAAKAASDTAMGLFD